MGEFEHYAELLGRIGREGATRSALERLKHGFFADKLDCYLEYKIVSVDQTSDPRDDMFHLTSLGLRLWKQEISIKDIMGGQ